MRPKAPRFLSSADLFTLRRHLTGNAVIDSRVIPLGIFPEQIRHEIRNLVIRDPHRGEIIETWKLGQF